MEYFFIFCFFILGLMLGSFFNVVGVRLPNKEPFVNDRSRCPSCKKTLRWFELIPVFSYIIQGGKCRRCKQGISPIYPVMELITGLLFAYSYIHIGFHPELLKALFLISMSIIIIVTDLRYMIIPNKLLLFFLPIFIVMNVVSPIEPWWSPLVGALLAGGIIMVIILISKGGMGAGDMKLFALLGLVLGYEKVLLALFLASFIGAIIGMLLLAFKIIKRKQPIPFGPYIIVGTMIAYYFGDELILWYVNLIV